MALYLGLADANRKGLVGCENPSTSRPPRTRGPITTGVDRYEGYQLHRDNERSRGMGPGVRRDDDRVLSHRVEAPRQNALLRVQAIFGLVEHHRLRTIDHLVGDLLAAMGGQAM